MLCEFLVLCFFRHNNIINNNRIRSHHQKEQLFWRGAKTDEFPSKNNLCNFVFFWTIFFACILLSIFIDFQSNPPLYRFIGRMVWKAPQKGISFWPSLASHPDQRTGIIKVVHQPPLSCLDPTVGPDKVFEIEFVFCGGFPGVGTVLFALTEDTDAGRWAHFDVPVAHVLWLTLDGLGRVSGLVWTPKSNGGCCRTVYNSSGHGVENRDTSKVSALLDARE